jgi:lipoprotein-releasing system permease protein
MSLLHLAWCYFRSRILLSLSAVAIALGVAVMFAVLAVINGFLGQVESTLREFTGDLVVTAVPQRAAPGVEVGDYLEALEGVEGVAAVVPRLNYYGLVGRRGARAIDDPRTTDLSGMLLIGVDALPAGTLRSVAGAEAVPVPFPADTLGPGRILVGRVLAEKAGVAEGDQLEVISFRGGSSGQPVPVRSAFTVAGIFTTGRYDLDIDRALVDRGDLARMIGDPLGFGELGLRAAPGTDLEALRGAAEDALAAAGIRRDGMPRLVSTWRTQGGNFLRAVENQKSILSTVFFFIVVVAAFQLVATLTLTVAEKRRDIGVLGALGASPGRIVGFFLGLGLVVAVVGAGLGVLLGRWLVDHLEWVQEALFGERIFNAETYIFDQVPVAVDWASVGLLVGATLAAALLFSFLPAWRAARLDVIDALRR